MRNLSTALVCLAIALTADAQSPAMKPFEINMDRVKIAKFGASLGESTTYIVPTWNLSVSAQGSVWAKSGGAKAHGRYFVDGLTKDVMQGLAKKLQDDLVARLRGAGYTVLTFDDVKSEPDVASHGLEKVDARYGLPTGGGFGAPVTFVNAAPSDAQAFDKPIQGHTWWLRGLAKAKNALTIIPEAKFTVPQMFGETESGYARNSAGIITDPAMVFEGATVAGGNAKGTVGINIQRHGKRLAQEVTGTIRKIFEDKTTFNAAWETTSDDWVMTLDQTAFSDGILRVGFAINGLIVSEVQKAHH
jgi:hypothetical protein